MNLVALKASIKQQAGRLGFMLAGFTTPDTPPHFSTYVQWLAAGHHGGMQYLSDERSIRRRSNPQMILPECKSILMLAIPYGRYKPPAPSTGDHEAIPPGAVPARGRVASYAWGRDYHGVLANKMSALVQFIEKQVGHTVPNRCYTDTGPVLERDLAQRAGLGWVGKNSCLINPELGSFFFLAETLLGLEIEPDPPFTRDHCGTCTRCVDACPTKCILTNRTLDAQSCISYLTIENKGDIPERLRPALGNWVFGCDVCQQVCPWNRFSTDDIDASFSPRPGLDSPDLIRDLTLSPEAFSHKFKGTAIKRAKRRGYLRNIAVVLGNSFDANAIPALEKAANDPEALIRVHAVWAVNQIKKNKNE